uniref:PDZ domain-containing protein n=1 Tax=Plectus sambesii TaxID=2011161 RepID=A0A914UI47_9BILA
MGEPTPSVSSWETHEREAAVLTAGGAMPATIDGGADRGAFLRIGQVLDDECGLRDGDIVLEVQGKAVSGMTRSDANEWLRMCSMRGGVVSFRLVEAGHLTADLRQYLAMRFPKGSVDHHLQNTIRDNVYLKTVPFDDFANRPALIASPSPSFAANDRRHDDRPASSVV